MKLLEKRWLGALVALPLATAGGLAQAASVDAIAVDPNGDPTIDVSIRDGGKIEYYIPLQSDGGTSGTYGVTDIGGGTKAGQDSDNGSGYNYGLDDDGGLFMYLYFDLASFDDSSPNGFLKLEFDDLDLTPDNDPPGFLEDLDISFAANGSDFGSDLNTGKTGNITSQAELQSAPGYVPGSFMIGNNGDNLKVDFAIPDTVWSAALGNDGVYAELIFGSKFSSNATNTPELLLGAAVGTNPSVVPIPAAAWLFGSAMVGMAGIGYRRRSRSETQA